MVRICAGALVCSLLFGAAIIAQEEQRLRRPLEPDGACGTIELRAEDWLRRHGDFGRIDPVRMRELVKDHYEKSLRERSIGEVTPSSIGGTTWLSVGPTNVAGRVVSIAPHPTIAGLVYVGTATGGVWMTNNSGASWTPLTDGLADLSVGAIAVAPSSPGTIYLGTGEPVGSGIPGIGFLSSPNSGGTWTFPGTGVLATSFWKLSVNPGNALDVLAGTNSGGFRSTDGGAHWTPWTVPAANTTQQITDIVRDPTTANTLYASTYYGSTNLPTVLKSVDGGSTWTAFGPGLPSSTNMRRIMLAIDSTGTVLYAAFELSSIAYVYKSTSGGAWANTAPVDPSGLYSRQGGYNNAIIIAPGGSSTVILCGVTCSKTTTGGNSWAPMQSSGAGYHVDFHDLRFDAGGTLYMGTDGGIYTSTDTGISTANCQAGMVTTQFYGIANDPTNATRAFGGLQDSGSWRKDGTSTEWVGMTGSDGGQAAVDRENPSLVWTTNQVYARGNHLWRTKEAGAADPLFIQLAPNYEATESFPFPSMIKTDPLHPSTVYTCSQRLWKSITGGDTWSPLPTTTTDGSTWNVFTIYAIAIARSNPSIVMVAKGPSVYRSTTGGSTWQQTSTGLPDSWINDLDIDPRNPEVAYAALATTSGSSMYATSNGGATWTPHYSGLPNFSVETVRVDPTDSTTVYCGTPVGVYRSIDSGATWTLFGSGIPRAAVYDLRITDDGSVLRAGTFGRGVWELQIPAPTNHPPSVAITSPASQTVARNTTLTFTGNIDDIDEDSFAATWSFPDTWERAQKTTFGTFSVSHTFSRAGIWPVTLASQDEHGAASAATVVITVNEAGDSCSSPIIIPNSGTGPATLVANSETWTGFDGSDPSTSCWPYTSYYSGWFDYTAPSSGTFTFSTCGSTFDTLLSAYTGVCGSLTQISGACNGDVDPDGTNGCNGGGSMISVALTAGQTAHLRVASPYYFDTRGVLSLTVSPASSTAPTVRRIATTAGPSVGGTPVTIYGSNFAAGPTVLLGGVVAGSVDVASPYIINAVTPPHNPGVTDVVVMNADAQSGRLVNGFTYSDCAISLSGPSTTVGASSGAGAVFVTATSGCGWSAWSNAGWLTTTSSGIGSGTVSYGFQPNALVIPRTATISIANQTFTVTQSGILPYNMTATATSTTAVAVNWFSATADHFEIWRNDGTGWVLAGTATVMSFTDSVTANHTYVYRARAVDGVGGQSAYTTPDLATTMAFTDNALVAGSTVIKAVHLAELRQAVDAVRAAAAVGAFSYTDSADPGVTVRLVHLTELRSALDAARSALGIPTVTWSAVSPGSTVLAAHFTELRNALK
jgi:IPT/TIG domain-containing protein/PKD domain-containing protein